MGLLNRRSPRDPQSLCLALKRGTYEEFVDAYSPAWLHYDGFGYSLLELACGNKDLESRVAISSRLLDDGADASVGIPAHVLVSQARHDFVSEAALLRRLIDLGADPNLVDTKVGTPLEASAAKFAFSDRDLAPFYDVLLGNPELDLLQKGLDGRVVLVNLRKWYVVRADLVERCEALLTSRGIPVPPPDP